MRFQNLSRVPVERLRGADIMHAVVRNIMLADASVAALLGQNIHWSDAPANSPYPLAVLQKVSERRSYTLEGDDGLGRHLVQIDVYASEHRGMRQASQAVCKLWSGLRSAGVAGAFVQNIRETVERDTGADGLLYRVSLDVLIIIKETSDE